MDLLIGHFRPRLNWGASLEIVPLMSIPKIKQKVLKRKSKREAYITILYSTFYLFALNYLSTLYDRITSSL